MRIAMYANVEERGRFLRDTSAVSLAVDTPDKLRFDQHSRELIGAELQLPDDRIQSTEPEDLISL
ncbi:hypothetical protein [Streptomyces sp. NPDC050538]|uniref:hypothetical protein n=1 Tax=Streptomyces sp. NPDC050538 TaxID=3365627 RepID=UPI0037A4B757